LTIDAIGLSLKSDSAEYEPVAAINSPEKNVTKNMPYGKTKVKGNSVNINS